MSANLLSALHDTAGNTAIPQWLRDEMRQAADEIERLRGEVEKLRKLIEAAPAVAITECNQILGASDFDYGDMSAAVQKFRPGQRVRLVAK